MPKLGIYNFKMLEIKEDLHKIQQYTHYYDNSCIHIIIHRF